MVQTSQKPEFKIFLGNFEIFNYLENSEGFKQGWDIELKNHTWDFDIQVPGTALLGFA